MNYPMGADNPNAPWNRITPEEISFEVLCSQSLSKTVPVVTDHYTPIYEKEIDCDDLVCSTMDADTSNIDWKEEFHENDHYTPEQLLGVFKKFLEDELNGTNTISKSPKNLEWLIQECQGWEVDEEIFEED